jgi:membrane-bound lytic murein transglycosylase A
MSTFDERLWGPQGDRAALLRAIDHSLRYLNSDRANAAYSRQYARTGITRERVRRSLVRFRHLVKTARTAAELDSAVQREFLLFEPGEKSGLSTEEVHFTGYYEPVYQASLAPSATYRYPLYRVPAGFSRWKRPHPNRAELEGKDGLQGARGPLRGSELVYLRSRLEAFLIQVQGSARLQMTDGRTLTVGYADHTDHPYTSVGRQLVKDGKIPEEKLTLQALKAYFHAYPQDLDEYLPRNQGFVFVRLTRGAPATGSIGAPVTAERSIATDKAWMPPGAIALIQVNIANPTAVAVLKTDVLTRYVLDQDIGSAIKGPRRVDIFMGSGPLAEARAGVINSRGRLYYLLLK